MHVHRLVRFLVFNSVKAIVKFGHIFRSSWPASFKQHSERERLFLYLCLILYFNQNSQTLSAILNAPTKIGLFKFWFTLDSFP